LGAFWKSGTSFSLWANTKPLLMNMGSNNPSPILPLLLSILLQASFVELLILAHLNILVLVGVY